MKQNPNSHLTAKKRDRESFPTRWLHQQNLLSGRVLDFGCGYGADLTFLEHNGYQVSGYDTHYQPQRPKGRFNTIICNYVLNVLLPGQQADVLMDVSELLEPTGRAYFTVRRDLKNNSFRKHAIYKLDTWQCVVKLPWKSVFKNHFCEIYEYRHFNQIDNGKAGIFENPGPEAELISELVSVYSMYDCFPVSEGHALVIPKRLSPTYFDCTPKEQQALWLMVNRVKQILEAKHKPDGFNIGINCGQAAGQTIPHTHIHVIPRYRGDVPEPEGGIRNVIPGMGRYGG